MRQSRGFLPLIEQRYVFAMLISPMLFANRILASLLPRKGRNKPGSEGEDLVRGVAGEPGNYGCLAVDNLYNIMHTTDRKYHFLQPLIPYLSSPF